MDLDALRSRRRGEWDRLDELSRSRNLSGADVDELVIRYRAASADLSDIKTSAGRTQLGDSLSVTIARARHRLTGAGENITRQLPRFFALQLPAALYRLRWTTLVLAVATLGIAALSALWISADPALIATLGSQAQLQQYAENDFTDYYEPGAVFAGQVWTNNAWIAAQCVMFGVTGIFPVYAIMSNAMNLGVAGAVMLAFDRGDVLILSLLPHGLLELTSIFVAAAAGLHVFWSWVAPGRRTRGESLASAGRALAITVIGLILSLALSGLVEGFVTGQPWPAAVKITIGALALAVFLFYMLVVGRWAKRRGETGDLTEYEAGTPTLYAG